MSKSSNTGRRKDRRKERGTAGETLAVEFLEKMGMKVLQRNYRFERGEIDIVAEDGRELVFVEVKARRTTSYGEPIEAVDAKKQAQLWKVAEGYLYEHRLEHRPCRFDVVAIFFHNGKAVIKHFKHAF
jgi:putative endonuclease